MNSWFSRKNAKTESAPAPPRKVSRASTAKPKKKHEPFITRRWIIFFLLGGIWLLLAGWTLSAFFEHIDTLNPSYKLGAYAGACVGEFAGLWFLYLKSFDHSLTMRRWSLVFSIILACVLVLHSGALIGMKESAQAQAETETVLTDKLGQLSQKQMGAVGDGRKTEGLTQAQKRAQTRTENRLKGDIAKNAQKELTEAVKGRRETIQESGIFPPWYFKGWMYIVIFAVTLLLSGILAAISQHVDVTDIDANYDGIPDIQEGGIVEHKGKSYALDPETGEASEEYAEYLKWKENPRRRWAEDEPGDSPRQFSRQSSPWDSLPEEERDRLERRIAARSFPKERHDSQPRPGRIPQTEEEAAQFWQDQDEERAPRPVAKWRGNTLQNPEDFSPEQLRTLSESRRANGQNGVNGHVPK